MDCLLGASAGTSRELLGGEQGIDEAVEACTQRCG